MLEDPSLDEDIRDVLANTREKPCIKHIEREETLGTLEEFPKDSNHVPKLHGQLEARESAVDTEAMLMSLSTAVAKANAAKKEDTFILHFGPNNSSELIERICRNETPPRLKTGYVEYDKTSHGSFPDNGVVILAGTTSGGKSNCDEHLPLHVF